MATKKTLAQLAADKNKASFKDNFPSKNTIFDKAKFGKPVAFVDQSLTPRLEVTFKLPTNKTITSPGDNEIDTKDDKVRNIANFVEFEMFKIPYNNITNFEYSNEGKESIKIRMIE